MAQLDQWDLCSGRMQVPSLARHSELKDPALPQLWLGSDPWPGNSICQGDGQKRGEKKKRKQEEKKEIMGTG